MKRKIETLLLALTLVMTSVFCYAREEGEGQMPAEEEYALTESERETEETAAEEALTEMAPDECEPSKEAEKEEEPAQVTAPGDTDMEEEGPAEEVPDEEAPAEATDEEAPAEVPDEETPEEVPDEETPAEEAPARGEPEEEQSVLKDNLISRTDDITDGDFGNFITVTWKDVYYGTSYDGKNDSNDAEIIKALTGGKYVITITVADCYMGVSGETVLMSSGTYEYQLAWPDGDDILVKPGKWDGDVSAADGAVTGEWSISEDGILILSIDIPDNISEFNGYISIDAEISCSGSSGGSPVSASVEKKAEYDPYTQKISWEITATVPAWDGRSEYSKWRLEDIVNVDSRQLNRYTETDFSDISVKMALTSEYEANGEDTAWSQIPGLGNALEGDDICFYVEQSDYRSDNYIWFLNRCGEGCGTSACQNSKEGKCLNQTGGYEDWCTCWHQSENLTFRIDISTDVGKLINKLQTDENDTMPIENWAGIYRNDDIYIPVSEDSAEVALHPLILKQEVKGLEAENNYIGEYEITVNPYHEDFSGTDCIIICDSMQNLSYELGSMEIVWTDENGNTGILKPIDSMKFENGIQREGNENQYFSVEAGEVENADTGDDLKQDICISIWFPSNAAYTVTYKAMAVDVTLGSLRNYGNTASIGSVSASVSGKSYTVDSDFEARKFRSTVKKVDIDDNEKTLSGAQFNVFQYIDEGSDRLITTLITADDGTSLFQESRRDGIYIYENTLYYFQEAAAPTGYMIDDEKYYFYFSPGDDMQLSKGITAVGGQKDDEGYVLTVTVADESRPAPCISKYLSDLDNGNDTGNTGTENGSILEYRIIAENIQGTSNLVIHDWLDDQLIFDTLNIKSVTLYRDSDDEGTELEYDRTYFITDGECSTGCGLGGCSFEIHISDSIPENLPSESDARIEIIYDISLGESSERFNDDLINEIINYTWQSYDTSKYSEPDTAKTVSFGFNILKCTQEDMPLTGAEFILFKYSLSDEEYSDKKEYAQFYVSGSTYLFTGWTENICDATAIITGKDGKAAAEGFGSGTYFLRERKAPDGYALMENPVKITVEGNEDYLPLITVNEETANDGIIKIENEKIPESPEEPVPEPSTESEPATEPDQKSDDPEPDQKSDDPESEPDGPTMESETEPMEQAAESGTESDDQESESETETETETESETEQIKGQEPESESDNTGVNTGDDTRIFTFIFLMIMAFLLLMTEIIRRTGKAHR